MVELDSLVDQLVRLMAVASKVVAIVVVCVVVADECQVVVVLKVNQAVVWKSFVDVETVMQCECWQELVGSVVARVQLLSVKVCVA